MSGSAAGKVHARRIVTSTISTRLLQSGPDDGKPVLFLHGNFSSADWWERTMAWLPRGFRGLAFDLRGFGEADASLKIDATVGLADCAADAVSILDRLSIPRAHVVGNSLGGNVVWRLMMDYPDRLKTVTLVAPGSPFGFGATRDVAGTPCTPDFAGSGAGIINRHFLQGLKEKNRSSADPFSPRQVLRANILGEEVNGSLEETLMDGMMSTHLGPEDLPGDVTDSPEWPYFAPGRHGAANALSPRYFKPPRWTARGTFTPDVLWIRGGRDQTVADEATSDPARLGRAGLIPGWPGAAVYPPQPMIGQTRAVLERYAAAGGSYREAVIDGAGHVPFVTHAVHFNEMFHHFLLGFSPRG
jgi:pimeloyl-ACP methyl ester carboxylesterase